MSKNDTLREEIDTALLDHVAWKHRLREAAFSNDTALPVQEIADDTHCRFGRWLATVEPSEHNSYYLERVKELHAEFHAKAGAIAKAINEGDTLEGLKALNSVDYNLKSKELSAVLMDWKARC